MANMSQFNRVCETVWALTLCLGVFSSPGCSAHNTFNIANTTRANNVSKVEYAPHDELVFVTKEPLPVAGKQAEDTSFDVVAKIEVGKVTYSSVNAVYESMATRARKLGADAVVQVKTWRQPCGWAWAAPHGSGIAIKFKNLDSVDFSKLKGEWH